MPSRHLARAAFSSGRTPGSPDSNEFITIRLDRPLQQFVKAAKK